MLAGPHPRSLSLGGAALPRFPPAPRSGRGRSYARGAPPPLALTRRRGFAALPSGASLGPRALLCSRGPTPARSHSAARLCRASLQRLARAAGALMLAGPHPRSLSLGGAALPRFPPAPRSGRGRSYARGAPPPLALTRRRGFAALPSGASLGPRALLCSRGPTPARSHSAARLCRASLRRLARAAGALMLAGPHPRSLSLGGAALPRFPPAPRSGRGRSYARGLHPARSHSAARLCRASLRRLARAAGALMLAGSTPLALTRR